MDLQIQNNYSIADGSAENVDSLMECTDAQRLSLDEMSFGEFSTTNIPTMLAGSLATVNGSLCGPATTDGVPLYIGNDAGSTFQAASAAPENVTLYLCLIPSAPTAVTYSLKACAAVAYSPERRGFYEVGTQNRVFGECRKVSGAYPSNLKRLYVRPENIESFVKMYSDGLEVDARKILPAYTAGRVSGAIYSLDAQTDHTVEKVTNIVNVRLDYPAVIEIAGMYRTGGYPLGNKHVSGCEFRAVLLDADQTTEIGIFQAVELADVPGNQSSAISIPVLFDLPAGAYRIKLKTVVFSFQYETSTQSGFLQSSNVRAYVRNPQGNRLGEWGAVI